MITTTAEDIRFSKSGDQFLYTNKPAGENQWRKHHTSVVTRDICVYDLKTGTHKQITSFKGEDRNPIITTDEIGFYF